MMNKKEILTQKELNVTKLFITIVITLYTSFCFSQTSILGTYYIDYKLTDFGTNYTFYKNGILPYSNPLSASRRNKTE